MVKGVSFLFLSLTDIIFYSQPSQHSQQSQGAPLSGLSGLVEKLMGEHSEWLKLAWQGRDEAAAAAA